MNLNKIKKKEIIVGLMLSSIILLTILIQFSDHKISSFREKINVMDQELMTDLLTVIKNQNSYFDSKWKVLLNPPVEIKDTDSWPLPSTEENRKEQELTLSLSKGKLDRSEYYYKLQELYGVSYLSTVEFYNNKKAGLTEIRSRGTIWTRIKAVSFIAQLIILLFILVLYYFMIKNL